MPIYIHCPNCKNDQNVKNKRCKKCSKLLPKQNKTYRIVVKYAGNVITKCVPNSLELAREIESKIRIELVEGSYFNRHKKIPTLNEVWQKYLVTYKAEGKAWAIEENRYNTRLKHYFGKKPLDKISVMDVQRIIVNMRKIKTKRGAPYSPKSIRNTVELLSRLLNFAMKQGMWKGDNPCKRVKLPRINNEVTNVLDTSQVRDLLDALSKDYGYETANLIKLLMFTGIRRGEAFKITWNDIDFKDGWLYLRDPKGGKDQVIPLNNLALEVLRNQTSYRRDNTALIFPSRKGTVRKDIKRAWAKIKKQASIPDSFRLHDLRHTYASLLASSGEVDLYTLQKLLTHKSPQMTQRYAHLVEGALKRGAKVMDGLIDATSKNNHKLRKVKPSP